MSLKAEQFSQLIQSQPIEVIVIPDPNTPDTSTTFCLSEELLKSQSNWFETKLAERWSLNGDGKVRIVGFTIEAFQIFVFWVYRQGITITSDEESTLDGRSPVSYLLQAWLLFDFFIMPVQQNLVMDQMCKITATKLDYDQLVDEQAILLAESSGEGQLMKFTQQAMAMSLATERSDWLRLPRIVGDSALVQGLWDELIGMLNSENVVLKCLLESEICACVDGRGKRLKVQEDRSI